MEIKVLKTVKTDVAVVGGGTAGVMAAVSASDAGAETLLIEKNGMLGGTMTAASVNFPGLFYAWGKRILGGKVKDLPTESIRAELLRQGAIVPSSAF